MEKSQLIAIGKCGRAHGIKGAATLILYNSGSRILQKSMEVYLCPLSAEENPCANFTKTYHVRSISYNAGSSAILSLEQILDRTQLEGLLPFEVMIPRTSFPPLIDPNEFYLVDLLNMTVVEDGSLKKLGFIQSYYDHGAGVILVINLDQLNPPEILELPFINAFFPYVSLSEKIISIQLPEWS